VTSSKEHIGTEFSSYLLFSRKNNINLCNTW
jgi:hypothetical protein